MWIFENRAQSGLLKGPYCIGEVAEISRKLSILKGFVDLNAGIIWNARICRVLKEILELETLSQDEFQLRSGSAEFLEKLNKILY